MKVLLVFLKSIYFLVTSVDRLFFKFFRFLVYKTPAKVISIGNLSMGGTGKTPVLFEIISELKNEKLCVISRGYRSPWENSFYRLEGSGPHPKELTDEALLFNLRFPMVPILLGKRRDRSARYADENIKPRMLILDDGFQYRRLKKDIDLLLWDSFTDVKEAQLIPCGRLREPISRLRDASAILLTRCEISSKEQVTFWKNWLAKKADGIPIIEMKTICEGLFDHNGYKIDEADYPESCVAFSAIGKPQSFVKQLEQLGIIAKETIEFRDHHKFSTRELESLGQAHAKNGRVIICTEKDRVKVEQKIAEQLSLITLRIRIIPVSGNSICSELKNFGVEIRDSL